MLVMFLGDVLKFVYLCSMFWLSKQHNNT